MAKIVDRKEQNYHILATGFEPFGIPMPKDNPSWETLKLLDKEIISEGKTFHIHSCEIPVEYKPVEDTLPFLHKQKSFDYVLHIGQGPGSKIQIETQAISGGYTKFDNKKQVPDGGLTPRKYIPKDANPETFKLTPDINFEALIEKVQHKTDFKSIYLSKDAGRYLCEYTYFCSLGEARELKESQSSDKRKVIFVHVPRPDNEVSISTIVKVISAIITSLPEA